MWYRAAFFSISIFAIAWVARGQATPPTTEPIEPTTPKGALKSLAIAMDAGDRERIRNLMYTTSPIERKMIDVTSDMAVAIADLKHLMTKRYGEVATQIAMNESPDALPQSLAKIDSAEQKVDGDLAVINLSAAMPRESMSLVRTGDYWKISVPQQIKDEGLTPEQVDEKIATVSSQSRIIRDLTTEVTAGKYPTAADAASALREKMSASHEPASPAPPP
jgi:hypothetical protein